MENITRFFYNIIPGSYFLYFLIYLLSKKWPTFISAHPIFDLWNKGKLDEVSIQFTVTLIIISLLVGFLFQSIIKLLKDGILYEIVMNLISRNQKFLFDEAKNILEENTLIDKENDINVKNIFFIMNNYLSATDKAKLVDNFWHGNAFWGNLFIGSFLLIIIQAAVKNNDGLLFASLWIMMSLTFVIFILHLYTMHDIVLKTFVAVYRINPRLNSPNP